MKVALALALLGSRSGGMAVTVPALARALGDRGVVVTVVGAQDGETNVWAVKEQIRVLARPTMGPRSFAFAPGLKQLVASLEADLLHLNGIWSYASLVVRGMRRGHRAPIVVAPRGMLEPWALRKSAWKKALALALFERDNLDKASCLQALCSAEVHTIRAFGLQTPIAVVPNGVDLPSQIPDRLGQSQRTLLFLGRIDPKKGVHELVRGWGLSGAAARGWRLRIIGWGEEGYVTATHRLVRELGLEQSIELAGPAFGEAKDRAFREAGGFVLPSYSEGLPMAVLEAWSYALPVLVTPACNLPEGFERGAAVEIGTEPERIAEGIRTLVAMSDAERTAMGTAGRRLVEDRFTWPKAARQMIEVYEWVLGGGPPPACVVTD